jgi:hypothetical protein
MRIETEAERQAAERTLKEVMEKLEEALRLSRKLEQERACDRPMAGTRG